MAKRKISATVDPVRLEAAQRLAGLERSVSEVLDLALAAFVTQTREQTWLAAHGRESRDLPGEVPVDLSDVPWQGEQP